MLAINTSIQSKLLNAVFSGRRSRVQQKFWEACNTPPEGDNGQGRRHWRQLRKLLKKGADINARAANGDTPLIVLCRNGFGNAAYSLISVGADTSAANNDGTTALLAAAADCRSPSVLVRLSEEKADILATDNNGKNALQLLIAADVNPDKDSGAACNLRSALYRFIHAGLTLDDKMKVTLYHDKPHLSGAVKDIEVVQELLAAAAKGDADQVHELLYWGVPADEPATFYNDHSPLAAGAEGGHIEVMEKLIKAGAKIDTPSPKTKLTPLQHAARGGCMEAFNLLLDHGAKLDHASDLLEHARQSGRHGVASAIFDTMVKEGVIKTSVTKPATMKPLRLIKS